MDVIASYLEGHPDFLLEHHLFSFEDFCYRDIPAVLKTPVVVDKKQLYFRRLRYAIGKDTARQFIPFPLNGYQGFDHLRVKEVGSAGVFSLAFLMYVYYLYKTKLSTKS